MRCTHIPFLLLLLDRRQRWMFPSFTDQFIKNARLGLGSFSSAGVVMISREPGQMCSLLRNKQTFLFCFFAEQTSETVNLQGGGCAGEFSQWKITADPSHSNEQKQTQVLGFLGQPERRHTKHHLSHKRRRSRLKRLLFIEDI